MEVPLLQSWIIEKHIFTQTKISLFIAALFVTQNNNQMSISRRQGKLWWVVNWMFVSLPSHLLTPNPHVRLFGGEVFGRELGHKLEPLRMGLVPLREEAYSFLHVRIQGELGNLQPRTWPCWHLTLRFPASRTSRNKLLLFISCQPVELF